MILAMVRVILVLSLSVGICIFGIIYCLLNPVRQLSHNLIFGHLFGYLAPIFGIQVEIRNLCTNDLFKNCIYIANHQNNYDMVTVSYVIPPGTLTIGKKNLLWIPLFGLLFWLSGNILINRTRSIERARRVLMKIIKIIRLHNISVLIFPEGTRNRGRGLLPFKTGAFYIAVSTKIPIVLICVSNMSHEKIKLNRWSNGLVIIEILPPPINIYAYDLNQVRRITAYCHKIMQLKIDALNQEVLFRETHKKFK